MSETNKWFDPALKRAAKPLPIPQSIVTATDVTVADARQFIQTLRRLFTSTQRVDGGAMHMWYELARMRPAQRLKRNLKILLDQLTLQDVNSVLVDGLTKPEREALVSLELLGLPTSLKVTAQGLLNVYERYQLAMTLNRVFKDARTRRWEFEDAHDSQSRAGDTGDPAKVSSVSREPACPR